MTAPHTRQYQPDYGTGHGISGGNMPTRVSLAAEPWHIPAPITLALPAIARGPERAVVQTPRAPRPV